MMLRYIEQDVEPLHELLVVTKQLGYVLTPTQHGVQLHVELQLHSATNCKKKILHHDGASTNITD